MTIGTLFLPFLGGEREASLCIKDSYIFSVEEQSCCCMEVAICVEKSVWGLWSSQRGGGLAAPRP